MFLEGSALQRTVGVIFGILVGGVVAELFVLALRRDTTVKRPGRPDYGSGKRVDPRLTGLIERLFFLFVVAYGVNGAGTAMIGLIAAKMVANWNTAEARLLGPYSPREILNFRFTALLGGLVAMLFAMLGGLIYNDTIAVKPGALNCIIFVVLVGSVELGILLSRQEQEEPTD